MAGNQSSNIWLIIIGGTIGNLTEWYNMLLYGFLASVMSQVFFTSQHPLLALTLTFSIFAITFFMRPLGGILLGRIGDVYGRQRALIISVLMMGVATFLIGCLPSYEKMGIASPLLLCLLRMIQGLSTGGEHTGSAIYMAEQAPPGHRAFWVSTIPTSAALGILISSMASLFIVTSFSNVALLSWGWRVGYWIGTLLSLISVVMRLLMPETPQFKQIQKQNLNSHYTFSMLIHNKDIFNKLSMVICLTGTWGVFYQILFVWMPTYLTSILHFSYIGSLLMNTLYLLSFSILVLLFGYLADFIPRKLLLIAVCSAMFVLSYPLFILLSSGEIEKIHLAMGVFTFIFSMFIPSAFMSMIELFAVQERYTSLSFSFNMGLAIFGGTCPLIATWLIAVTHNIISPAYYLMVAALLGLLTCIQLPSQKEGKAVAIETSNRIPEEGL